jgi:AMP-polyphosphate phosphotransferase
LAVEDMMEKTSALGAPRRLIPANDKPYGRLAALRIIADRLSKDVSLEPRALDPKIIDAAESLLGLRLPLPPPNGRRSARPPTEA